MTLSIVDPLNAPKLIFDLQQANRVAQRIYACLDAQTIATQITQGLVQQFGCALARIWLVEPDGRHLKLVASSGLYTHTDGSFSRVPMGAFKVGKIAQNRVSFLSNNLPNEPWVKDRDWAIQHQIQGFAGYPLATPETVVGVLAIFSYDQLEPEFLEVLLSLCTTTTVALGNALQFEQTQQAWQVNHQGQPLLPNQLLVLSDLLAQILGPTPLKLVGTERPLDLSQTYLFMKLAEASQRLGCMTCGLTYGDDFVTLNTIIPVAQPDNLAPDILASDWLPASIGQLVYLSSCLGGTVETGLDRPHRVMQILLKLPNSPVETHIPIRVQCRSPVLQLGFTQMVKAAGFTLALNPTKAMPLITDHSRLIPESQFVIWVQPASHSDPKIPSGVKAVLTLDTTPAELNQAIQAILGGGRWGLNPDIKTQRMLSEREQEVMQLLAQGLRDRDIAQQLCVSESTVKFHVNNLLAKLNVKTRLQGLHELMHHGWLD